VQGLSVVYADECLKNMLLLLEKNFTKIGKVLGFMNESNWVGPGVAITCVIYLRKEHFGLETVLGSKVQRF
jgi:hypothetical protein